MRGGESLMVTVIRCGTGSPKIIQKPEWWVFLNQGLLSDLMNLSNEILTNMTTILHAWTCTCIIYELLQI